MSEKAESGTVLAVCVSREKGTQKQNVGSAHFIEDFWDRRRRSCRKMASAGESSFS